MAQVIVASNGPLAVVELNASGVAKVYLGENTAEASAQAAAAEIARQQAEGLAIALEVASAGGWYDTVDSGAADTSVAEGDGYFVVTAEGRVLIAQKVSGVGTVMAEFATMYMLSVGAGGGINADKLDGNDASFFTDIVSRLGFTPLDRSGDTMTGALTLHSDPTADDHASTKSYVDDLVDGEALLAKIKELDGEGSGLDADTVRGHVPLWITESSWTSAGGYEVRSDGVIRCRGKLAVPANGTATWNLPKAHESEVWPAALHTVANSNTSQSQNAGLTSINYNSSAEPVSITFWNAEDFIVTFYILTEGK